MLPRTAPYKDFLQPALQRRFSSTATVLLVIAYIQALLIADWTSYFWAWFPIGPTGIRSLFFFTCGLAILVLRIAHYHVGVRTSRSPFHTLFGYILRPQSLETFVWYAFSSLLFCTTYLVSSSGSLSWVTYHTGDRARLNERPLFVLCYALIGAIVQTVVHRANDTDRLDLGQLLNQEGHADSLHSLWLATQQMPKAAVSAAARSFLLTLLSVPIYLFFLRGAARGWALFFLRPFFNLPRTNAFPQSHSIDKSTLMACIGAGILCTFMWMVANTLFGLLMVKAPLKNGRPLTSDSKDPNGSLLNGLKSKKLPIQYFAMWELLYITKDLPDRRAAIYNDIDRREGTMWYQVYTICMGIIKSVEFRIDDYNKASVAPPPLQPPPVPLPLDEERKAVAATVPASDGNAFSPPPPSPSQQVRDAVGNYIGQVMRSPGRSPLSQLSPKAQRTLRNARDRFLSKEQQEAIEPKHIWSRTQQMVLNLAGYPWVAALFRVDLGARLTPLLLGSPYAEKWLYINAATALAELVAHSVREDPFGNVHRDVAVIVRDFTAIIKKAESLRQSFPAHWTDMSEMREAPDVDAVVAALRKGLEIVIEHFEPYRIELRLTMMEMKMAKEAARMGVKDEWESRETVRTTDEGKVKGGGRNRTSQNAAETKDAARQRKVNIPAEKKKLLSRELQEEKRWAQKQEEVAMPEMRQLRSDRPW